MRLKDGRETTVSNRHLAPTGDTLTTNNSEEESQVLAAEENETSIQSENVENQNVFEKPTRDRNPPKYLLDDYRFK